MGKGVVKVVHRCDDAKENSNLGEWGVDQIRGGLPKQKFHGRDIKCT